MLIGGFQKFSLIDYPGNISAIVFTRGCNFRCPYCHNPELVKPESYSALVSKKEILAFLKTRIDRLQGVVITGGEPSIHDDLPELIKEIKDLGFKVKLDTNGSNPDMLRRLLSDGLMDFIAMDIKAPLPIYTRIVGASVSVEHIVNSIRFIIQSGVSHEFRTTYLESLLSLEDMKAIAELIAGCNGFALQRFAPTKALEPSMLSQPAPTEAKLQEVHAVFSAMGIPCIVR